MIHNTEELVERYEYVADRINERCSAIPDLQLSSDAIPIRTSESDITGILESIGVTDSTTAIQAIKSTYDLINLDDEGDVKMFLYLIERACTSMSVRTKYQMIWLIVKIEILTGWYLTDDDVSNISKWGFSNWGDGSVWG